jgi:hypothetical protein
VKYEHNTYLYGPVPEYDAHVCHTANNKIAQIQRTVVKIVAIGILTKRNP